MRYRTARRIVIRAAAVVALAGCRLEEVREVARGNQAVRTQDQRPLLPAPRASHEVARMLYERNLISDTQVNRKMNEAVLHLSRGAASRDSVMPIFLRWLEDWASTHPAEVEAARLAGGAYASEARRMYADTDSSRKAQTDSIRRLVVSRASRRIEAAKATLDSARSD